MIDMADSTTFPFAIFRLTNPGDTEANIADKEAVGMNIGVNNNFIIGLTGFKPTFDARRTDVGNPDNIVPSTPDTGVIPPVWQIDFIVDERLANQKAEARLAKFMLEEKANTTFKKGRIGIRYDAKPEFNFTPAATPNFSGGKIISFPFDDVITWGGLVEGTVMIQFNGNPATLIAQLDAVG